MKKLRKTGHRQINRLLDRLKPGKEFVYADKKESEFFGPNKPRYVDPWVKHKNKLVRVSSLVPSLDYYLEEFSENYKNIGVKQL